MNADKRRFFFLFSVKLCGSSVKLCVPKIRSNVNENSAFGDFNFWVGQ